MKLKLLSILVIVLLLHGCSEETNDTSDTETPDVTQPVAEPTGWYMRIIAKATTADG